MDFVRDFKVNYPVGFGTRDPVHAFLQNDRVEQFAARAADYSSLTAKA